MPVGPNQIIENENRIRVLELTLQKLINQGSINQQDLESAKKKAAKELGEKYEEVDYTGN